MGIFRQFPYSNFHEMNLDWIINTVKQLEVEWDRTRNEWASYKEFIDNYFKNLDVTEEVLNAMRIFADNGTLNEIMDPVIIKEVIAWLNEHITPTTPAVDSSLSIAGAAADAKATGDAIREISEETNNIWKHGDVSFTEQYNTGVNMPAGEYNISGLISDGVNTGSSNIYFYDENNNARILGFPLGHETQHIITFDTNIVKIRIYARTAYSDSVNRTADCSKLLITAGHNKYTYRPGRTAIDYTARDYFNSDKSATIYASGFLKDYISAHNGKYVLMQSTDGIHFSVMDVNLPATLMAYDASAIITYDNYFIIGVHDVINNRACMQFFTTKDFVNWTESIVEFPEVLIDVYNSAIAFYIDNGELHVSWSAEYQTIEKDPTIYHLPHWMRLSFENGVITGSGSWGNISIGSSSTNDSYIDPFVLKIENGYVVAIKNEITRKIELYNGANLANLTLYREMEGLGVEAPSMLFDSYTRTITLYGSGYWLGDAGIDILLYDSWRVVGDISQPTQSSKHMWSLAEYYSNYQIRHPYISKVSANIKQLLSKFSIVPAPAFPYNRELHYTQQDDGKFYMGDRELTVFIGHPRIRFHLHSNTTETGNVEYGALPLKNEEFNIIIDSSNGNKISFPFANYGWGDYYGKRLESQNDSAMVLTFKPVTWESQYSKYYLGDANALSRITDL